MSDDQRQQSDSAQEAEGAAPEGDARFVVVTPDGMGVADGPGARDASEPGSGQHAEREHTNPADLVEEPAKVMRIGTMVKQLLEEVRNAPLDEAGRTRLADIYHRSIEELKDGLAPELVEELDRIALPFTDTSPSDPELRIAQAQIVGWLEGLFHGIQTALVAQQMAAQQQLQQMRALPGPPGLSYGSPPGAGAHGGMPQNEPRGDHGPTGQYL